MVRQAAQRIDRRACTRLMNELLKRKDIYGGLTYAENKDFFLDLRTSDEKMQLLTFLAARDYITCLFDAGNMLVHIGISDKGLTYFQDLYDISREKRLEWIRYSITTAIALIALIKAFFF